MFSAIYAKFHVFSNFGHFHMFSMTLDQLTQNWVQFIQFSSVEAQLPDSAVFHMFMYAF